MSQHKYIKFIILAIALLFIFNYNDSYSGKVDSILSSMDTLHGKELIDAQLALSSFYKETSLEKAMYYAKIARENAILINDTLSRAKAKSSIGNVYYFLGDFTSAITHYKRALHFYRKLNYSPGIAFTLNNIGLIYRDWKKFDLSADYLQNSLDILKRDKDKKGVATCLSNLGTVYQLKGNLKSAKNYFLESFEIKQELNDKYGMANSLTDIGKIYSNEGDYERALYNFNQSLLLKNQTGDTLSTVSDLINIAALYQKKHEFTRALVSAEKALAIAKKSNMSLLEQNSYSILSNIYESSGDFRNAMRYLKLGNIANDSANRALQIKKINDFNTRLSIENTEKENQMLRKSKELSNSLLIFSIIIIILFVIIIIIQIIQYRNKKEGMKLLEEKNIYISQVNKKLSDQNWLLNNQKKKMAEMFKELEDSKEKLKLSNSIKDKFFNIVVHELQEPFKKLQEQTTDVYDRIDKITREEAYGWLQELNSNADRLETLINNLLIWSKAQTESINFQPASIELKEIIDNSIKNIKPLAIKKSIEVKSSVNEKTNAFAAYNMIAVCLNMLLSNAVKFTPKGGSAEINVRDTGHYLEIEVKDTGIGINNEDISKIFRQDIQFSKLGTGKEKGSGLGLSICKEFIRLNGGRIWAESELGAGSSFKFTLPKRAVE